MVTTCCHGADQEIAIFSLFLRLFNIESNDRIRIALSDDIGKYQNRRRNNDLCLLILELDFLYIDFLVKTQGGSLFLSSRCSSPG